MYDFLHKLEEIFLFESPYLFVSVPNYRDPFRSQQGNHMSDLEGDKDIFNIIAYSCKNCMYQWHCYCCKDDHDDDDDGKRLDLVVMPCLDSYARL